MRRVRWLFSCLLILLAVDASLDAQPPSKRAEDLPAAPRQHALLLVGLPGDPEHDAAFRKLSADLYQQLLAHGFDKSSIRVLLDKPKRSDAWIGQINRKSIKDTIVSLEQRIAPSDLIWIIFVGHANHDGEHARFHIPGPDLRAVDYADLFDVLPSKQQVVWVTTSCSGHFTEPLSKQDRIVITATAQDAEPNETEFPRAMATALSRPRVELDDNKDGQVSLLELFAQTIRFVQAAYEADKRAVTEHATIDDNGDGKGSEWREILKEQQRTTLNNESPDENSSPSWNAKVDGVQAMAVIVTGFDEQTNEPLESEDELAGEN